MSNITGQKGTRQLEMAAKGCPAETPWCHLCAKICAHTPRPGSPVKMMMMMMMRDCGGQVVFIKRRPLRGILAGLTYPPSHCNACCCCSLIWWWWWLWCSWWSGYTSSPWPLSILRRMWVQSWSRWTLTRTLATPSLWTQLGRLQRIQRPYSRFDIKLIIASLCLSLSLTILIYS